MKPVAIPVIVQAQVSKLCQELNHEGGRWRQLGGHKPRRYRGHRQPIVFALLEGYYLHAFAKRGSFEFELIRPSSKGHRCKAR